MHDRSHPLVTIDVSPLLDRDGDPSAAARTAREIDRACRDLGFFLIAGHGVDAGLRRRLDESARRFFARPDESKRPFSMASAGPAWRGWFPLRGEITSGRPDRKEGFYVGVDHPDDHPRVAAGTPLHGRNVVPDPDLGEAIDDWMSALRPVADAVLRGMAAGLGMPADWFERDLTHDPTILFRIFRYPALPDNATSDEWGVGEHTDYGLLTLLAQDSSGGLEVRAADGRWISVPADPELLVCNLGDMLDRLTEGRYRSTPHRVRNTSGRERLSFPYFFDPSWEAVVPVMPLGDAPPADDAARRWDGASPRAWTGTYGEYLTAKVAKVFPELFAEVATLRSAGSRSRSPSTGRDG